MFSWILKPSTRRKGFVLHGYQLLDWLFNLAFCSLAWYYTISIVVATPCCLVVCCCSCEFLECFGSRTS